MAAAAVCCQLGCDRAQRQFTYTINNGTVTVTKYTGSARSVVIPEKIHGLPVTAIGIGAFGLREIVNSQELTNVTIPNTVCSIGAQAFCNCGRLSTINLPESVTSIGEAAFADCRALTRVTIPDSVTSVGEKAFDACTALTNVTIGNGVTNILSHTFVSCMHLRNVTIGTSVSIISPYAFWLCGDLATVTILGDVGEIGAKAFYCPKLKAVYFHGPPPTVYPQAFSPSATLYYLPGTGKWAVTVDGCRTAPWRP